MKLFFYLCELCSIAADEGIGYKSFFLPSTNQVCGTNRIRTCDSCDKRGAGFYYAHPNPEHPEYVPEKPAYYTPVQL